VVVTHKLVSLTIGTLLTGLNALLLVVVLYKTVWLAARLPTVLLLTTLTAPTLVRSLTLNALVTLTSVSLSVGTLVLGLLALSSAVVVLNNVRLLVLVAMAPHKSTLLALSLVLSPSLSKPVTPTLVSPMHGNVALGLTALLLVVVVSRLALLTVSAVMVLRFLTLNVN